MRKPPFPYPSRALLLGAFCLFWQLIACGPPSWPGGIHARLAWSQTGVRVVSIPTDSVAARAGLRVDDRLVQIDGKPIEGMDTTTLRDALTGEVGSPVTLQVQRGDEILEVTIERVPYGGSRER